MRDFRRLFVSVRDDVKGDVSCMEGIPMKWLLIALLIAISPTSVAHSGTFLDVFHDRNLDGWHVSIHPPGIALPVAFKNGYLVMDTTIEKNELPEGVFKVVSLELRTGNAEDWDSYTLTCRIRFVEVRGGAGSGFFNIGIRSSKGRFDLVAEQVMQILLLPKSIDVTTIPPDAKRNPETKAPEGEIHRRILLPEHFPAIKLN